MIAAAGGVSPPPGRAVQPGFPDRRRRAGGTTSPARVARSASELSRLPDVAVPRARSHGGLVRDVTPGVGAAAHAAAGFSAGWAPDPAIGLGAGGDVLLRRR
jgi:hypothetical protein